MSKTTVEQLLNAGVHFGHLRRKWNPAMAPYIFMEKNGIHIIDLQKTVVKIDEAASALKQIAKSGRKILFVATKKQAKDIVSEKVKAVNMPYVTERWPGGMLTNFPTIRKAVKKMTSIDRMATDGTFVTLSKRERLQVTRQRAKLEKNLGSIADLSRLPAALFIIDVSKEHIAVREANRLNIPVFAMVDTNSNPNNIDFVIPANDDAAKSISLIVEIMTQSIYEGLEERKLEKDKEQSGSKDREGKVLASNDKDSFESDDHEDAEDSKDLKEIMKPVVKKAEAKETSVKETPVKETSAKEVSTKKAPAKKAPAKKAPAKKAPLKKKASEK